MANGTLPNLAKSAFVRTPRALGHRVVHNLLRWPTACTVLDPTAGEGDLLYPTLGIHGVNRFGIEISAERANVARDILGPTTQILTAACEAVHVPRGSMSALLANPPYFFTNGKRAEYIILSRAGEALMPGGILVAIIPARSAWDAVMINHWLRWYDHIRVWKFPNRSHSDDEGAFEDFTQICMVGIRRAEPVEIDPVERKRLQGYRWRVPLGKSDEEGGWEYGTPPLDLPEHPIDDPYQVPFCRALPELVVRRADEATLLEALAQSGAHHSPEWDTATYWPEEEMLDFPSMPLTGAAHLAAAILNDAVGGQVITGPEQGPNEQHCLFTAFIGSQWVKLPIGNEERSKLREDGIISASARQWQDQPVLGVMDLDTGTSRYYEGDAALTFLQPWLKRLSEQVTQLRPPLYLLDPADWELRLFTQFATDKRLPGANYPGLAPAQIHRICAMGRSLDLTGRTAIQGEPGTGKTRMGTGSAARQAYRWRYRIQDFAGLKQPAWIQKLRRAWLKNPRALAFLGLTPVYGQRLSATEQGTPQVREDQSSHQIVAYRENKTGHLILPEEAGPRALPVLVTTPKKVTKEYGKEIQAAWPQAEIMGIESYQDIPRFMQRCAESSAPAVVGIFSHSTTRAFGCEWLPAIQERVRVKHVPDLDPPDREHLEEVRNRQGRLQGYRVPGTDRLVTKEQRQTRYLCPNCLCEITATPGAQLAKDDPTANLADQFKEQSQGQKEEEEKSKEAVTNRVYFEKKQRWCRCQDRRNQELLKRGLKPRQQPLWTQSWRQDLRAKYPALSFAQWDRAMERMREQARQEATQATTRDRLALLSANRSLQIDLIDAALTDETTRDSVAALAKTYTPPTSTHHLATTEGFRQILFELVQRHPVTREKLVGLAEHLIDWTPMFFQAAMERWQQEGMVYPTRKGQKTMASSYGVRLQARAASHANGTVESQYGFSRAVPSSFSPYDYLYRAFRGCIALAIVDESHNGRGASTDIAHAHHLAMLAAQTRELTSGTHYGGDILSFYHYWFRFHPAFWKGLDLGWRDAAKALKLFGVIQEWTKEYESDARRGSGQTDIRVSTIPAPGLSSKLIPRLLTDLNYLTVLDVGAFMPPRVEIPELVNMRDMAAHEEAKIIVSRVSAERAEFQRERANLLVRLEKDEAVRPELIAFTQRLQEAEIRHAAALARASEREQWAEGRDLEGHYRRLVSVLEKMSQKRNQTARMGKGTLPRWFAALPCDAPFTLEQTERGTWGEELGKKLLISTERLEWNYLYPAEVRLREIVLQELAEKRRVMVYIEQNELRSMSKRLAWVFKDIPNWALPNSVKSEDRQQAILEAVHERGIRLLFVPYRKVNEGLNLQSAIDTIIWYEMAMNLFLLDQASRRAWRLGKQEEVRIYYLVYAGTAGHSKLRKLGNQSGAAAAFAGEPARGALIEHAGADKTTLAQLAAFVDAQQNSEEEEEDDLSLLSYSEEEAQQLKDAFARRAAEEREALKKGRQWLGGVVDTLPTRLPAFFSEKQPCSVWKLLPSRRLMVLAGRTPAFVPEDCSEESSSPIISVTPLADETTTSETSEQASQNMLPTAVPVQASTKQPIVQAKPTSKPGKKASVSKEGKKKPSPAKKPSTKERVERIIAAELIFGNEEHIALVHRPKRSRKPASLKHPKRATPVEVRTIAAADAETIIAQVIPLSLWELASDDPAPLMDISARVEEHTTPTEITQHSLW